MKRTGLIFGLGIVSGAYVVRPVIEWMTTDGRSVTWLLLIGLTAVVTWHIKGIVNDRSWEADVRKRAAWCLKAPHLYAGAHLMEPSRVDPGLTIFSERVWYSGPYPTEAEYVASDQDQVPRAA